ncbi:hypothetical protein KC356_g9158 [Hortaea werneckii]|nr:hypothetical protein KC356_g9158 [Hortaea werneckii]
MAAATMTNSWAHAVPLDETTGYPPPPRAESMRSSDSRPTSQHRRLSARRRSDFHLPSDAEPAAAVRASSRASNMRKRSRNALREEDGSNSSKQHPQSRAEESAWIHRDKLAEIEIREMEEAGIHVRQSRRSESRGPADRRQERGSSRSMSRSELYRRGSRDRGEEREDGGEEGEEPTLSPHYASFDEFSRRKRVSTIPAVEDEEEAEAEEDADKQRPFDHNLDSDFRTPEEIEAERAAHRQRITRPSTSRLPVSKVSPVPVPQTVIGRDSPLPRSRNGSGAWSGHWDDQHYARRARSGSVGSQVILDDPAADTAAATYPTYSSSSRPTSSHLHGSMNETSHPRKARVPTKPLPTSGGSRKVSNTTPSSGLGTSRPGSSSTKPRQVSTSTNRGPRPASSHKKTSPSPGRRPSSSHNNNNNTHNRPEGEAPWIASMYKPDPRLPQDQQMLPTHAKRMMLAQQQQQQEQAKAGGSASQEGEERGGGRGATSGGGGRPPPAGAMWINEKGKWTDSEPSSSSRPNQQRQGSGKAGTTGVGGGGGGGEGGGRAWPLSPSGGISQTSPSPKSPGSGAGGYRITPTISPPAQIISRKNSGKDETNGIPDASHGGGGGGEHSTQQPSQYPQQRHEEGGEGEEEEKGSDPNHPKPNAAPLNATPRISPPPPAGFAATTTMTGNTATVTAGGRGGVGTGGKEAAEEDGSMKKKGKGGCLGCCVVM